MTATVGLIIACIPLILFSFLAYWKNHAMLFLILAANSLFVGLKWYDVYVNDTGLAISIGLIAYALVNVGMALKAMIGKREEE
jgi:hypothetical protein